MRKIVTLHMVKSLQLCEQKPLDLDGEVKLI